MNLLNHGESSGGPSVQPAKRRRGRPRRDASLKHAEEVPHMPPGFEGLKGYTTPERAAGTECMVGQTVTGVVEAIFDGVYLLNVRIGDSSANLRGVVFKPGHCIPITAENDVAPHVQMITRNDGHFTAENRGGSRRQRLAMQTAAMVPSKRKYVRRKTAPSVVPVGTVGSVVPIVSKPVSFPSGMQTSDVGDEDVHMAEPISMLPPDKSIGVGRMFATTETPSNHQVTPGSEQEDDGSLNDGTSEEKTKPLTSTGFDTPGTSQTSDGKIEDGKGTLKSSADDSGGFSKPETGNTNEPFSTGSLQATSVMKPFFNYGTGRMTELLQAVHENMKETRLPIAEPPSSTTGIEFHEATTETDPKNQARFP